MAPFYFINVKFRLRLIPREMRNLGLSILAGVLIGTSYIPFPPWALPFCLVPLWIQWLKDPRPKSVFFHGWVTQFVLTLIGFHWIANTTVEFGHLPWAVGVVVAIGFAAVFHWYIPLSGLVWALVRTRAPIRYPILFFALSYCLFESIWPTIFPWNLGYPWLWGKIPLFQWADVVGFQGLSLFTLLLNVLFYFIWTERKNVKRAAALLAVAIVAIVGLSLTGAKRGEAWKGGDGILKVLAIQANIGNLEKYWVERGNNYQEFIIEKYIALAQAGLQKYPAPDLLFFPETALPINLDVAQSNAILHKRIMDFFKKNQRRVLTGAYSEDVEKDRVYNALFFVKQNGEVQDLYRKSILLAFGEYFPGAETFPFLKKVVPAISDFGAGLGPKILDLGDVKAGPQICYEGLFPDFSRNMSQLGAEVFFNVTNDSWFGEKFEPFQHLYMTLGRAIEFRRPLMRVTNTGITSGILADGTILEFSPPREEWFHQYDVSYRKRPAATPYENWGKLLPFALLLALLFMVFWGLFARTNTH
jgi:apolipoprotein N-acyltransferase